jgi:hypothetical protein
MIEHQMTSRVYFKVAYTCNTKYYNIPHNWSISQLINTIRGKARQDFQIHTEIDIVEAGQPGISEEAPALEPEQITFQQKYLNRIPYLAFYIRPRTRTIQPLPECMLCQETNIVINPTFGCAHQFCQICSDGCITHGHSRCPICRHRI